jgi:hypothetical protein
MNFMSPKWTSPCLGCSSETSRNPIPMGSQGDSHMLTTRFPLVSLWYLLVSLAFTPRLQHVWWLIPPFFQHVWWFNPSTNCCSCTIYILLVIHIP